MQRYASYKPSGVEWLGDVPSHWRVMPGFTCFKENKDRNKALVEKTVLSLSYGRIVIKPEEKMTGLVPESFESYQRIRPGDIVIRTTDLQNDQTSLRVGLAKDRGMITSAYLGLRCNPDVNATYVYRLLESYDALKVFYGMGSGLRQNLDFWDFKRLPIALPPRDEQDRIVAFLDQKTAEIDAAIAKKRQLIALLQEQKSILVNQAVTQGLNPDTLMRDSGVAWISQHPAHWRMVRIKYLLKCIVDTEHKTPPMWDEGEALVVRTTNVRSGQLRYKDAKYTDEKTYRKWTRRAVPMPGDILFTREAPAGEACVLPEGVKSVIGQRMVLFKVDHSKLDANFAVHSIYAGAAKACIELMSVGSTVAHFNMSDIGGIPILLPPLEEQREISRHIDEVEQRFAPLIAVGINEIGSLVEYKKSLISTVIQGQVRI